jgi:hypothetical protein
MLLICLQRPKWMVLNQPPHLVHQVANFLDLLETHWLILTDYRHIVGALQYCTLTRPDIAYSVNQLCQFLHSPTTIHLAAAKRVLRYLKGTADLDCIIPKVLCNLMAIVTQIGRVVLMTENLPRVMAFILDHASFLGLLRSRLLWLSLAQRLSIGPWLLLLLKCIGFACCLRSCQVPLVHTPCLWVDNIGALSLSSNPVFHARTKHIEVDYHFIREKIFNKDLFVRYISTHSQPSDIFTKGVSKARFLLLRDKLMVFSLPINLRGNVN